MGLEIVQLSQTPSGLFLTGHGAPSPWRTLLPEFQGVQEAWLTVPLTSVSSLPSPGPPAQ